MIRLNAAPVRKHPSQVTKRLRFQLMGSGAEAISACCRRGRFVFARWQRDKAKKVSLVSMRLIIDGIN